MSVVALERAFPSIWAQPVLHAVDLRIFTLRYFRRCMECGFCSDQCCNYGVDIDVENIARLDTLGAAFDAFIGAPKSAWFAGETIADPEFPGGAHRRTASVEGRCVFRATEGRGCRIHAFCLDHDLDYHRFKPLVSTLFPLTFERGVLVPSEEAVDGSLVCSGEGDTLYAGARGELAHYFGADFVARLDRLEAAL